MRIESGPTRERLIRVGIFFLMCAGMGAYFLYDGYVGYPAKNIRSHVEQLPPELQDQAAGAAVHASVTREALPAVETAMLKVGRDAKRAALEAALGGPPSFEAPDAWWWYGPVFRYKIPLRGGEPAGQPDLQAGPKSESDLYYQKVLGAVLCGLALIVAVVLVRIATTRAVLDEKGLSLRGRPAIAFDEMKRLEDTQFRRKGWLDLVFAREGREERVRLDEYHLGRFAEIVAAICERKGFRDPVAAEKAEKEARAAGAA